MKKCSLQLFLLVVLLAAGVILYNYWSLSCGRCTVASFYRLSTPAAILLFCNLVAGLLLGLAKLRRRRQFKCQHCLCGSLLQRTWLFCPDCGAPCKPSATA